MGAGEPRAIGTPDTVVETSESREPVADPTLGIAFEPDTSGPAPAHRLVAVGDSLTHGFKNMAIRDTHLSYPALLARALGLDEEGFRHAAYASPGGLPLDLEWLLRGLQDACGDEVSWGEGFEAYRTVRDMLEANEDFWERGRGREIPPMGGIAHNLAVYGWDLRDALSVDADALRAGLREPRDNRLPSPPENAGALAGLRVLNTARDGAGEALTPLRAAAELGEQGGIETLVVFLGSNNALGTVLKLEACWSQGDYADPLAKHRYTVWNPKHFSAELAHVVARVRRVRARHVLWLTVPHVTIAPLAKGVHRIAGDSRYFAYYTRPWIDEDDFDPERHRIHLTGAQARDIDRAIDQYNTAIVDAVAAAREDRLDWRVVDVSGVLDRLAYRRYLRSPDAQPSWWERHGRYELPPALVEALGFEPTTEFLRSGPGGVERGGLVSIDGIHPTTSAYAVIAHECLRAMLDAGVEVATPGIDFAWVARQDTLLSRPLTLLDGTLELLEDLDGRFALLSRFEQAMRRRPGARGERT